LFQSIGLVAMYNMAYGRDCKLQNGHCNGLQRRPGSTWRWLFAEQMPLSPKHFKGRLALFRSIALVAMCNMAYGAMSCWPVVRRWPRLKSRPDISFLPAG
jgi:hypothetical protein